jgi:hypothetical protein
MPVENISEGAMNTIERALIGEIALLAIMGPLGIVRLWYQRRTEYLRLSGAAACWIAIGWTMLFGGIAFPESLFELFFVGVFLYGAMIYFTHGGGVDKMGVAAVMLLAFLYSASAYFNIYVLRTSGEQQALDAAVVAFGYVGFLLACWPALKEKT